MIQEEGTGWRLAKDLSRGEFSWLIGGDHWATELTEYEWKTLYQIVSDLLAQYKEQKKQLLNEESISIEIEREIWWCCIDGGTNHWSLKLILSGDMLKRRGLEMYWPKNVANEFVNAMRIMWDSSK